MQKFSFFRRFLCSMWVDLNRAFISIPFVLTVLLLILWQFSNTLFQLSDSYWWSLADLVEIFNAAISDEMCVAILLLPIAAVPYSWSTGMDRRSGFAVSAVQRVGEKAYCLSKVTSVALSAFLAVVIAESLFVLLLLSQGVPVLPAHPLNNTQFFLLAERSVPQFIFVREVISGLSGALAAVFAMTADAFLHNSLAALISPLLGYYAWESGLYLIGCQANGFYLQQIFFCQPMENPLFSAIWSIVYLLTLLVLCGRLFTWKIRKEGRA